MGAHRLAELCALELQCLATGSLETLGPVLEEKRTLLASPQLLGDRAALMRAWRRNREVLNLLRRGLKATGGADPRATYSRKGGYL